MWSPRPRWQVLNQPYSRMRLPSEPRFSGFSRLPRWEDTLFSPNPGIPLNSEPRFSGFSRLPRWEAANSFPNPANPVNHVNQGSKNIPTNHTHFTPKTGRR